MNNKRDLLDEPENFSLALGGPLFQFFLRTRLSGPALELLLRRIIIITAIAWLPLLLLTAVQGHVISGVQVPFLYALDTHVRLLVVLPLLIGSEIYVHDWSRGIIRQFLDREIIAAEDRPRFNDIVASALRLRNSIPWELTLVVFSICRPLGGAEFDTQRVDVVRRLARWPAAFHPGRLLDRMDQLSDPSFHYRIVFATVHDEAEMVKKSLAIARMKN